MARYLRKYTPSKPIDHIFNEYRTHMNPNSYGRWPVGYKNQIEHLRIESSPKTSKPEYDNNNHNHELYRLYNELKERSLSEKENNISRLSNSEIDIDKITQTIAERIESLNEFAKQDTPKQLPTLELGDKTFFFDARLWELRNINNPSDRIDLRELEFSSADQLLGGAAEKKEQQHESQPDKTNEISTEQNRIETSPKTETHQEPVERQNEPSYVGKIGLPEYHAELGQADITERSDIRIRRKPGPDFLEAGW